MENTIRSLFDEAVEKASSKVMMEYLLDGERKALTYSETYSTVRRLAELFNGAGIDSRKYPVALILDNCHEWI